MKITEFIGFFLAGVILTSCYNTPKGKNNPYPGSEIRKDSGFNLEPQDSDSDSPRTWTRILLRDTAFLQPCVKCMELKIPFYGVNSNYDGFAGPIFFNRYDFQNKQFSSGIFPTGDRVIVVDDLEILSETPFNNMVLQKDHKIHWTDSTLFFSFLGRRRNFGIFDETTPMRQFRATHYIIREGNGLTHAIFEDTIPPFETPDSAKILMEGAVLKIKNIAHGNELRIFYDGDSATWKNIEIVIEN